MKKALNREPSSDEQALRDAGFKIDSGKALRALAESGFVQVRQVDGKRKVEILPRGRTFLAQMRKLRGRI